MVLAAVGILAENPNPSEAGDPRAARGQPLPLHRLPEHRPGGPGRRDGVGEGRWPSPGERSTSAPRRPARRTPSCSPARRGTSTTSPLPGHGLGVPSCAARTRTRACARVDVSRALEAEGVVAAFSGADLRREWGGLLLTAWPRDARTRRARRTGRSTPDVARYAGDGVAVVVARDARAREGRGRARRGRLRAAARGHRRRRRRSRTARRSSTRTLGTNHCYTWPLQAGETSTGCSPRRR